MACHSYIFPDIIGSVAVTDSRERAKEFIKEGYYIFSVPQMFGTEIGQIVLCKEKDANHLICTLEEFEQKSRNHFSEA